MVQNQSTTLWKTYLCHISFILSQSASFLTLMMKGARSIILHSYLDDFKCASL